ncbi:hydrogenase expression/formation C-terminal domain-containing protein [Candidatus Kryptobacter tengchongensis]|uniref:Hydrogenase-1 operon protein HyaF n=1 Tax=Kryptobacter tengchongensis TaxID=1643429 RepID=A0A656D4D2_KRYT1|nr:hydrogenase expression/formation C-terminal domain-containing protein [Candidatus Kryptobacter tengchongensis]CUS99539.1 hydrogenase-1 operon protein HyaF [Candidatus Kryptobacter tengchongensis]CUT02299.1 hydrogenase-1 operon protein HyaF [Candidatus Kryptobacter tengchongensis]
MESNLTNAVFLLNEIKHALIELKNNGKSKTINLSNFPLSYEEAKFLDEVLGRGKIKIIYESSELTVWQESKISGVWWGEYRNSSGKIILRTIEITFYPEIAKSQVEDIEDGLKELEKILSSV